MLLDEEVVTIENDRKNVAEWQTAKRRMAALSTISTQMLVTLIMSLASADGRNLYAQKKGSSSNLRDL